MNIEAQVRQAFAGTRPPSGDLFATSNDEGAANLLGSARWEQIDPERLSQHSAAVNFLTPSAFAYFLPAFILASLQDAGVRDSLLSKLVPPKADLTRPSFASWWAPLTPSQKVAVVAFMDHCRETGSLLDDGSLESLKRHGGRECWGAQGAP